MIWKEKINLRTEPKTTPGKKSRKDKKKTTTKKPNQYITTKDHLRIARIL